jgi:hypothetical protein
MFPVCKTSMGWIGAATKEGTETEIQGELGITISLYF